MLLQTPALDPWTFFWPFLKILLVIVLLGLPLIFLNEYLQARIRRWNPKRRR